jgi:hypothetical protein
MTEEERAARRKQMEERMKNMSPEERKQWEERMASRGQGGGRGQGPGNVERPSGQPGGGNQQRAQAGRTGGNPGASAGGSVLSTTTATTVDALFAPLQRTESRGQVWLYINKQLKMVRIRTGITDGTWSEIIESSETAELAPNTEVVTNVVTGLEPANRPGGQGAGGSPLMGPQRGQQPGRGGPGGQGGGGRGR